MREDEIRAKAFSDGYTRGYQRGQEDLAREMARALYSGITLYLESNGVPRADEKANYICQFIKEYPIDEYR